MELTRLFSNFIVETAYENLPQEVCCQAKERLLDTIGAMLSGRAGWNYAEALLDATAHLGQGDRTPIGPNPLHRFPAARVAMLNATFAHAIELDDGHKFAGVHAGAVVVPTALEMGAVLGCSGKEILTAIVLGYEIIYRLAIAQSPTLINRGFHPSATCDTIGAMVVAGKLMNLNAEQLANGIGMAGLQAAGLMEATVSGQQSKCVMVGNAALNGISCSYISRQGLEGTTTVFEGKMGLFRAMSKEISLEEVCKNLGQDYLIGDTYNKFYPTCRHAQPAIEATLNLAAAHNIDANQVDHVIVGTHQVAYDLTGTIHEPQTPGEAKFSIPYSVALALKEHGVSVLHLQEKQYTNPDYLALANRVSVQVNSDVNAQYPKRRGAKVEIVMKDGTELTGECYDLKGSPQNPVGFDELEKKFVIGATGLLIQEAIDSILNRCANFENETDINSFLNLLNW